MPGARLPAGPGAQARGTALAPTPDVAGPLDTGADRTRRLLSLTRRLRAHERRELTEFLHDGPIQELTALTLELELRSRAEPGPATPSDAKMLQRLQAATGSLHWLVTESWSFLTPETGLAAAITQRTSWLLSDPVTVDTGGGPSAGDPPGVPVIVDVVELLLLELIPPGQRPRAHVAVRSSRGLVQIVVTLTTAGGGQVHGDPTAARASLDELACALGASARATLGARRWRVRVDLPS
jgi:hypothetical protein